MICDQNFRIKKGDCVRVKCHEQFKSGVVFIIVNSPVSISQNNKVSRGGKWAHKTARPRELQGASPPEPRQIITIIWNGLPSEFQNTKICVKYEGSRVGKKTCFFLKKQKTCFFCFKTYFIVLKRFFCFFFGQSYFSSEKKIIITIYDNDISVLIETYCEFQFETIVLYCVAFFS